ncbi:response regulator [Ktedonospora formicarum]|uniref:Response regulatory domain-containing protein n=1 Tax=Ktedonospora formicarum TaxID=2778364 RepID=A0A8J3HYZ8_9CHLR|nr:hypothetical protein [Ktedonospora formicarum]GHO43710.1 hypothetical protein KSX_18730 [Ktedonospora formicarum]
MHTSPGEQPHVLLIESDMCLRRLIAIGLQSRGMQVSEFVRASRELTLKDPQPDLLVVDVDGDVHSNWSLLQEAQALPSLSGVPTIVLCWERECQFAPALPTGQFANSLSQPTTYLTKPFDARVLHQAMDQLLQARAVEAATQEADLEAALLASYSRHSAPSIFPMVTAAGLLLLVISMLLMQVALGVAGFLIVIIALLCWTLGGEKPAPRVASA